MSKQWFPSTKSLILRTVVILFDAWSMLSQGNLSKAWNKLILAEMQEPEPSDDLTEIVNLAPIYLDLANITKKI